MVKKKKTTWSFGGVPLPTKRTPAPSHQPLDVRGYASGSEPYSESEEEIYHHDQDLAFLLPVEESERLHWLVMREALTYFAAQTLRGPEEAPYNGRFLIAEHHESWSDHLRTSPRLCILAPRDHGKSAMFSFAYGIWMAWKNPGKCGFIFSATQAQASRILRDIREEIEQNPRLRHLLPEKLSKWNDHEIRLANGHTIYARGYGTRVRGAHPVWLVCDDVLNDETAYSETVRKKQNDYFFSAISNMVVPGGQIVVVGTPLHSSDLYSELKSRGAYAFHRYQALDPEGRPLWRERYSKALLQWKRDFEIGALQFAREFQCEPVADDVSLYPSYLFTGAAEVPQLRLGLPRKYWSDLGVSIYIGVDFAISASAGANYTVIWVMGVDAQGVRYIIDIFKAKGMPYRLQRSKIIEYGRRYKPESIFLEANQMQVIFGQELIADTDLPIKPFYTTSQKHTLERGLPSCRLLFESRKIRIPRGDERSVRLTNEWIAEMGSFIFDGEVKTVGKFDDMAMAFWICDQAIREGAQFTATFGPEVFSQQELEDLKLGFLSTVESTSVSKQERDSGEFTESVQIVAGDAWSPEVDPQEQEEEDDPFTGRPISKDWRPPEGAPRWRG